MLYVSRCLAEWLILEIQRSINSDFSLEQLPPLGNLGQQMPHLRCHRKEIKEKRTSRKKQQLHLKERHHIY